MPPCTLTGDVQRDLVMIHKVIGFGEISVSDHRHVIVLALCM